MALHLAGVITNNVDVIIVGIPRTFLKMDQQRHVAGEHFNACNRNGHQLDAGIFNSRKAGNDRIEIYFNGSVYQKPWIHFIWLRIHSRTE